MKKYGQDDEIAGPSSKGGYKFLVWQFGWMERLGMPLDPAQQMIWDWYQKCAKDYSERGICCIHCHTIWSFADLRPKLFYIKTAKYRMSVSGHCPKCGARLVH